MLQVDLAPLDEGVNELALTPSAEDLELAPETFQNIVVDLRLDIAERRVMASFSVEAEASFECDRTLVEYQETVHGEHTILFLSPDQIHADSDDDTLLPLSDSETALDLTYPLRDTLLLALPLRHVAPNAEHAEITTSFGNQQTIDGIPVDDRWDALRNLRTDTSD